MAIIGDEVIQAAIIAKLKTLAPFGVVASTEIRELEWQGDSFTYPNIRVELEDNTPYYDEQLRCGIQRVEFSVYVFSEQRSSKEASQIKTLLTNALVGDGFSNSTYSVRFLPIRILDNVPAIREDERIWRAQIKFGSKISSL